MMHKDAFEAVNRLLCDIMDEENRPFGGKTVVFGGDFRQILPVIPSGSRRDVIENCINKCSFWPNIVYQRLTVNQRIINNEENTRFAELLLMIGEGKVNKDDDTFELPQNICVDLENFDDFVNSICYNQELNEWTILATKNDIVNKINNKIINDLAGELVQYRSIDSISENESAHLYPTEFLNSINTSGLPPHCLELKVCPSYKLCPPI